MRKEIVLCNACGNQIHSDDENFHLGAGKNKKKWGSTLALTAGGRNRVHLLDNTQLRISCDLYVVKEDGHPAESVDFHPGCLENLIRKKIRWWFQDVLEEDSDA